MSTPQGTRALPVLLLSVTKRRALTPNHRSLAGWTNPLARPGAREALVAHEAATGFGLIDAKRVWLFLVLLLGRSQFAIFQTAERTPSPENKGAPDQAQVSSCRGALQYIYRGR